MNKISMNSSVPPAQAGTSAAPGQGWVLPCVVGLALAIACQTVQSQAMYRIKPLGYLGGCTSAVPTVAGLNGKDEVAGTACNAKSWLMLSKVDGPTLPCRRPATAH